MWKFDYLYVDFIVRNSTLTASFYPKCQMVYSALSTSGVENQSRGEWDGMEHFLQKIEN